MVIGTTLDMVALTVGPFIVTGRYFDQLERVERAAVIAHETGHIVHRHAWRRLWWLVSGQWSYMKTRCQAQEYEADRYATMNGHGHGLIQFLSRPTKPHDSPLHPTHEERINNIMRWLNGR